MVIEFIWNDSILNSFGISFLTAKLLFTPDFVRKREIRLGLAASFFAHYIRHEFKIIITFEY